MLRLRFHRCHNGHRAPILDTICACTLIKPHFNFRIAPVSSNHDRSRPIWRAPFLISVDAVPTREGNLSIAPGGRSLSLTPAVAVSITNPSAMIRQPGKKTVETRCLLDFSGSPQKPGCDRFRKAPPAQAWGPAHKLLDPPGNRRALPAGHFA